MAEVNVDKVISSDRRWAKHSLGRLRKLSCLYYVLVFHAYFDGRAFMESSFYRIFIRIEDTALKRTLRANFYNPT